VGHDEHEGHAHEHEHEHAHAHAHAHERGDLSKGGGLGRLLFLDAPSGLAGDMIIAALVDLGVPGAVVAEAAAAVGMTGFHVHFGSRVRSGIVGTSFEVHVDEAQPLRTYAMVRELLDASSLAPPVKARAHATFRKLAEA
jgi:pyridinium-3,5-bisthiocarboxylic acid mononucleotide nickel chelatase